MGSQRHEKLNWLQRNLPEGLLVDAGWLQRNGYSRALRSKYVAHGWLEPLARSVYRRPFADAKGAGSVGWQSVVISLQMLLGYQCTVGGRSALELDGFAHYLPTRPQPEIHVYGAKTLPAWTPQLKIDSPLVYHNADKLFPGPSDQGLMRREWGHWNWPLIVSSPERAVLELLDEVPERESFHQADVLMEGLRNLSPRRLRPLLTECRSVKVKRLFLWFAERHNHAWLKTLVREDIDLGQGKRMLVRGGKLNTRYNITVPEEFHGD